MNVKDFYKLFNLDPPMLETGHFSAQALRKTFPAPDGLCVVNRQSIFECGGSESSGKSWSGRRESNPRGQIGSLELYH